MAEPLPDTRISCPPVAMMYVDATRVISGYPRPLVAYPATAEPTEQNENQFSNDELPTVSINRLC